MKYRISLSQKTLYGIVLVALLLSVFGRENFHAVQALGTHTITYFKGNKASAASFTFDDGYAAHRTIAIPQLNARGLRGTFFVITAGKMLPSGLPGRTQSPRAMKLRLIR